MAPRRKYPKVGLKRMDAAVDALTPMGFHPDVIRRKVKSLLKLYEGDQGWIFIEEAAYKLLIESLLEDQVGLFIEQGETSHLDSTNENICQDVFKAGQLEEGQATEASETLCSYRDKASATSADDAPLPSPVAVLKPTYTSAENMMTVSNELGVLPAPPGFERPLPSRLDFPTRKRKPCLGWMGPKDDNDYVLLNPLPVMGWRERRRKRKSRWDEMPDNVV